MSDPVDLAAARWAKSSYSDGSGGNCLEFSRTLIPTHHVIPIRDSKIPNSPTLIFRADHWSTFIKALKQESIRN
jgi:hypothetical protein